MFPRKQKRKPGNSLGLLILAIVVFVDAGLALIAWQRYQHRQAADEAAASDRELMVVPAAEDPVLPRVTAAPVVQRLVVAPAVPVRASGVPNAASSLQSTSIPGLPAATEFYRGLKRQPRYQALVNAWTEEFVRHPALRALNHRYHQDHDAGAFVLGAVRSPEFLQLLGSFAARADLQGFLMEMTGSTDVSASARALMKDGKVAAALGTIRLGGLPSLAELGRAAQRR